MELGHAAIAFSALAQETRLSIFRLLIRQGPAGMPAGKIAERLQIPPNTLSFHLSHLAHAGLVQSRREGRVIHYSIHEQGIRGLIAYLVEDCCMDRPELCAPDAPGGSCCGGPVAIRSESKPGTARKRGQP